MSRPVPDGLEEAAIRRAFRDTSMTLTVAGVDVEAQTIQLGNVRGDEVTYRWERRDGGLRLAQVEGGER